MEEKNEVFDTIITFVQSLKKERDCIESKYKGEESWIWNTSYLLNQIIRQYNVPAERYLLSEKAKAKWDEITDEDITKYYYREKVICKHNNIEVIEFKGSSKIGVKRPLNENDSFIYRDVFHNEHVVPVEGIIKELLNEDNLTYERIDAILKKLYICRMLKEEDRNITEKYHRPNNPKTVIDNIYKKAGINIVDEYKL